MGYYSGCKRSRYFFSRQGGEQEHSWWTGIPEMSAVRLHWIPDQWYENSRNSSCSCNTVASKENKILQMKKETKRNAHRFKIHKGLVNSWKESRLIIDVGREEQTRSRPFSTILKDDRNKYGARWQCPGSEMSVVSPQFRPTVRSLISPAMTQCWIILHNLYYCLQKLTSVSWQCQMTLPARLVSLL